MSGVMSNVQYMPSPHGLSKRIRLHSTELYTNPFQETGLFGYPETTTEPGNVELIKSTHVWIRNNRLKDDRNAIQLDSGVDKFIEKLKEFSNHGFSVLQDVKETLERNLFSSDLVSENDMETLNKTCSKITNGTCKSSMVQTLNFSEWDLQDVVSKRTVKPPPLNSTDFDMVKEFSEEANILTTLSNETVTKHANISQLSDIQSSATSNAMQGSDFETCLKDDVTGIVDESCKGKTIPDFLNEISEDNTKKSSKQNQSCAFKIDTNESNTKFKCNKNEQGTLSDSGKFHCESELRTRIVSCSKNLSESDVTLEGNHDSINLVEKSSQRRDITIEPIGGFVECKLDQTKENNLKISNKSQNHVCNLRYLEESNSINKELEIKKSLGESHQGQFVAKTPNVLKRCGSETRVLSWKIYMKIAKRLPDYEMFSNVIQKAMRNVKHSKNYYEPISPEKKPQSSKNLNITNNVKLTVKSHKNSYTLSRLNTLLQNIDDMDDFLEYVDDKISEMILFICTTSKDIKLLEAESKDISFKLHYIRNTKYLAELDGSDNAKLITTTRNEILKLGDHVLKKIESLELDWIDILTAYKTNLIIVARYVYMLCSIPIESQLTDEPDRVHAFAHLVDKTIKDVEVKERELSLERSCKYAETLEMEWKISKFHRMDNLLDDLCQNNCE